MRRRFTLILLLSLLVLALAASATLAAGRLDNTGRPCHHLPDGSEHLEVVTVPEGATTYDVLQARRR